MSFDSLGLSAPILEAVADQGYDTPTPVQSQSIPAILQGHDVMAAAQTGTGKTAGFTLPLLERLLNGRRPQANQVRALVLTPTRELAAQVSDSLDKYSVNVPIRSTVVFGGVKINPQMMKLRKGVDVLVATPGRLLDLHTKNALSLDQLEILVLDEADRMLDMGFIHDIRKIIALVPARRQNLLFSATFSKEIRALAKGLIHDPVEISVSPENATAKTVEQQVIPVDKSKKAALLIHLVKERGWYQVLVFCRTKHGANKLAYQLNKAEITAAPIHGNKSQGARTRALAEFKNGELQVLVATDIAARGLDIDQLPQVVNFDLPHVAEDYVHRIGRTGRAGSEGKAFSLVCAEESKELAGIERFIQEVIPRRGEPGFTPKDKLPESPSKLKPLKPKKPKKPKKNKSPSNEGAKSKGDRRERQVERSPDNERRPQESTPRHKGAGSADAPRKRKPDSARRSNPKQGNPQQSNAKHGTDKQGTNQQGKSGQRQRSQSKSQPNSQSSRQDRQGRPEKQGGSKSQSQPNGRNKPKASGAQPKRSPRKRPAKNSSGNA